MSQLKSVSRLGAWLVLAAAAVVPSRASAPTELTFAVHHEAIIHELPAGAKQVRIWLVVPRNDPDQSVGEIRLSGPGDGRVRHGGSYGNRYAYFEVDHPASEIRVSADFTVKRRPAHVHVDPRDVQPLDDADRARLSDELRGNRYVPVNEKYAQLARDIVGDATNPVEQAQRLYNWELVNVEYWVKDPAHLKASPNGESDYCLASRTGNCSDFHSLFASLARSLGIPVRMSYGSLFQGENTPVPKKASLDGKDTDGSYHCWVHFYAKGIGWVPLDVALANLLPTPEEQKHYFGNLDARRVTWSYGRDLTLSPKQSAGPVNAMTKVYVEVDGKPITGWERKFTYHSATP